MNGLVEWANKAVTPEMFSYYRAFNIMGLFHWSRQFEYPWIMTHGHFGTNRLVLDAGGGNSCCLLQYALADRNCHVVNMDIDESQLARNDARVLYTVGDIHNIPFLTGSFPRVLCVSVMEHLRDPRRALDELYRVTAPGGRMLITMDVADSRMTSLTPDLRHGITEDVAVGLVGKFGLVVPPQPNEVISHALKNEDGTEINLKVLCFWVEKPRD